MLPEHLCEVCRQRLDAVAWSIGKHPGCGAYAPLTADGYDRLVAHLADTLGAEVVTEETTQ